MVAARLADADPALSVLVVEGGSNNESPLIEHPAFFLAHLDPNNKTSQFYMAKPSPHTAGRPLVLPTGNVLGGGSSTNMMMYSRAQRSDWDSWNTQGWSADEMVPYLKKVSLLCLVYYIEISSNALSYSSRRTMARMRKVFMATMVPFTCPVGRITLQSSKKSASHRQLRWVGLK